MTALYLLALPAAIGIGALVGILTAPHRARRPRGCR